MMAAAPSAAALDALVASLLSEVSRLERPVGAGAADGPEVLVRLETIMLNALARPGADGAKFRRLRCANPKIAELLAVPHAESLLLAFGFRAAEEPAPAAAAAGGGGGGGDAAPAATERVLLLAQGAMVPDVQAAVQRAITRLDEALKSRQSQLGALGAERKAREEAEARARMLEAAARVTPERRALIAQAKAKREAEEKEKAETLRQIKEDAEDRARKARLQVQRASQSPGLPHNGGGGGGGGGGGAMRTFKDIGIDVNKPKSS